MSVSAWKSPGAKPRRSAPGGRKSEAGRAYQASAPSARKMPGDVLEELRLLRGRVAPGVDAGALAGLHRVEQGDRGAPAALSRDDPLAPVLDHARRSGPRPRTASTSPARSPRASRGARRSTARRAGRTTGSWPGRSPGSCSASSAGTRVGTSGRTPARAPTDRRSSTIAGLASRTFCPRYFATVVKRPASSTGERIGSFSRWPTRKSSSPCPGAVWTRPVPVSIVTWSPRTTRKDRASSSAVSSPRLSAWRGCGVDRPGERSARDRGRRRFQPVQPSARATDSARRSATR